MERDDGLRHVEERKPVCYQSGRRKDRDLYLSNMHPSRERAGESSLRVPLISGSAAPHEAGSSQPGTWIPGAPSNAHNSNNVPSQQQQIASMRSRTSPVPGQRFPQAGGGASSVTGASSRPKNPSSIAPGQPAPAARQRDKFVPLDLGGEGDEVDLPPMTTATAFAPSQDTMGPSIFEDLPSSSMHGGPGAWPLAEDKRGRVGWAPGRRGEGLWIMQAWT